MTTATGPTSRGLRLFVCLILVAIVALFGAQFKPGLWYAQLQKPALTPPGWVFPIVWPVLYLTIALAGWWVWNCRAQTTVAIPLGMWGVQLVLNALWSWLFFGLHRPGLALIEIVILWFTIVATVILFLHVHRVAGLLLLPYLLWVSFAMYLNGAFWYLNT